MRPPLSAENHKKFVTMLGLPEDASDEQILEQMKLASEAQNLLIENNIQGADKPHLLWMQSLLLQKKSDPGKAFLFWEFFFDYDAEHDLGFMDAEIAKFGIHTK